VIRDLTLRCKRLRPEATLPKYATDGSAGLDLYAAEDVTLYPGDRTVVKTGIAFCIPDGWEGTVRPRSGNSRRGHDVKLGTVDSDYRGDVGVLCSNDAHTDCLEWVIKAGDRIAQLVLTPVARASVTDVGDEDLPDTERGAGGWGSTGK
jgi:dUTP pyrophosphatase